MGSQEIDVVQAAFVGLFARAVDLLVLPVYSNIGDGWILFSPLQNHMAAIAADLHMKGKFYVLRVLELFPPGAPVKLCVAVHEAGQGVST